MNKLYLGMFFMFAFFSCSEKKVTEPQETVIQIPNSTRDVNFENSETLWNNYYKHAQVDTVTHICSLKDTLSSADMFTFRSGWTFHRVYTEPGDHIVLKQGQRNAPIFEGDEGAIARNELFYQVLEIHDTYSTYQRKLNIAKSKNTECTDEPVNLDHVLAQSQKAIDEFRAKKVGVTPSFMRFIEVERKYFEICSRLKFPNRIKKTYHIYTAEQLNLIKQCVADSKIDEAILSQSYRSVAKAYTDYLRINDPEKKQVYGLNYLKNEYALGDYFIGERVKNMIRASNLSVIAFECGTLPQFKEIVNQFPEELRPMLIKASKSSANRKTVGQQAEFPKITGKDANGKKVSLKDFRGKWVLIDCWATWCGVCHGEIPYTNAMEKAFEGQNLVFFGASVDKPKDTQKWKDCLIEKDMKGVQIIVDNAQSMKEQLGIKGFPTYALINPEGKLVMTRTPRPSSGVLHNIVKAYMR